MGDNDMREMAREEASKIVTGLSDSSNGVYSISGKNLNILVTAITNLCLSVAEWSGRR